MNVCVVGGAGYVGLITGLGLAQIGHRVINVDMDQERIRLLQAGHSPIFEEGIDLLLQRNLDAGRLRFSTDLQEALVASQFVFITVGTPSREDGQADVSQVIHVAEELARSLDNNYKVVVLKSTVPVGTVELIRSLLQKEKQEEEDFDIVTNPEFLREGTGLFDFFYPVRLVLGASSLKAINLMRDLYEPIIQGQIAWPEEAPEVRSSCPVVIETDLASAQMIKYSSNAFLATRISFVNEIAELCETLGADIKEVARGMGLDPRIGTDYLEAGLGFGGPCIEKDLSALITIAENTGYDPGVLRAVLQRNEKQVDAVLSKLHIVLGSSLKRKIVAVLGLAFKAGTNDVRNSLALRVIDHLENAGASVRTHDPMAMTEAQRLKPDLSYWEDPYEAVHEADALLVLTEWPDFRELDYSRIKAEMARPYIIDARNLLDPASMRTMGFTYVGVGRP